MTTVAAEGYENVVVIGNDAPSLNTQILQRAISQLEKGRHVLGRDEHGGCYLIGLKTTDTDFDQFRDIDNGRFILNASCVFLSLKINPSINCFPI